MYQIKIASLDQFRDCRESWNNLLLETVQPSVFCTWEWIYTWWEHFGSHYELMVLFFYSGEDLRGILPLALRRMRAEDVLPSGRVLSFCGSTELYPDHLDLIAPPGYAKKCIEAVSRYLSQTNGNWDLLHLSHFSEESLMVREMTEGHEDFRIHTSRVSVAPYIPLETSFAEYMGNFSRKNRGNLNRRRNQLYKKFGVALSCCRSFDDVESTLKELFDLHRSIKDCQGIKTTFSGRRLFAFHVALAKRFLAKGWLRLWSLRKNGEAIAVYYGFSFQGRFSYYQSGMHPNWQKRSAGTVLFLEVIRHCFEEGLLEFDFLRGGEEYKYRWTNRERSLFTTNIYNKTWRGKIMCASGQIRNLLKDSLRLQKG